MTWAALQRRYCVMAAKVVFFSADTSTIRLLLAWASFMYGGSIAFHLIFHSGDFFAERPAYALMRMVASGWGWVVIFMVHFLGVHWRVLDPKERVWAGLIVNTYGFLIWFYSTLCTNIAIGMVLPSSALEWTMIFASGWALYRTGLQRELVSA